MRTCFSFALVVLLLVGCKKDEAPPKDDPPTEASHLTYFGFTLVDTYWDDPLDAEVKTNYSDEVYTFSNTADVIALGPTDNLISKLQAFESLDMKALIHLHELFFEYVGTDAPSGADYALRSDYQARWDEFMMSNDLQANQTLVQAFYVGEEPTWNGVSFEELEAACNYLQATLPEVPIMIIEAYPAISDLVVPVSADWIGFDHYFIADPQNDPVFLGDLESIRSKLNSSEQDLVLILDAHYIDWAHGDFGGISLDDMKDVATSYYNLARSDEDFIALFGYCWPGGFDDPNALGARQLPTEVQAEYARIGKAITGKE